jgi:hypothetical protein
LSRELQRSVNLFAPDRAALEVEAERHLEPVGLKSVPGTPRAGRESNRPDTVPVLSPFLPCCVGGVGDTDTPAFERGRAQRLRERLFGDLRDQLGGPMGRS